MNVKMQKVETNVVELEITVDAQKFGEALKKSYNKNARNFNVPGFRKGKVPMNIVKKYYGTGVLFEDAINFAIEESYPEALTEKDIHPVDYPEIDIVEVDEDKDFVYKAKVVVMPEVELGEYKNVEVNKVSYDVSDEDIEKQLKAMQEKNARVEVKSEGAVEKGNIAVIDFKGFVDGVAFEGGEGHDYPLEIGSGTFIGDFEDQLIGAKANEMKNVSVTFPENYGKEELNGKPATFEVTVKEIKVKELPELDDEFAQEVSEFDTLDELKNDISNKMKESNDLRAKREFEESIINKAVDNAKVEIPQVMVDKEVDAMLKDLEARLQYQGLDLESYYQFTNNTEEKMKEYMKENAERKVKTDLVLDKIAKSESIEASDEEIKEKALELAKQYGNDDPEKMAELLLKSQERIIKLDVVTEKTIKMLVENANIIE
ncbi:trigger factor [Clostridium polynesiense]|uniref:trigger factor n=1 Tax=Clostridium polynesiense TaxID=1325933 RepID=UPI00058B82AD|nr:trigger factor [Clostridium polynesiense]